MPDNLRRRGNGGFDDGPAAAPGRLDPGDVGQGTTRVCTGAGSGLTGSFSRCAR